MRIVHLVDEYQPTLTGYQETALPIRQVKLGHDVHVITGDRFGPAVKTLSDVHSVTAGIAKYNGVVVHRLPVIFQLPGGAMRIYLKGLETKLAGLHPDVVHAHNFITFTGFRAAKFKSHNEYRLVFDNHQCLENIKLPDTKMWSAFLRDMFYETFRLFASGLIRDRADAIVAVGESEREFAARYLGFPVEKIPIIRLGADAQFLIPNPDIRQAQRAAWGLNSSDFLAIYAGQFRPLRQLELLLDAVNQLISEGLPIHVFLIGTGYPDYLAKLKDLSKQPLLAERVRFLPLADKPTIIKYFNAADVGVWPRSYSVTFIEALACGLPLLVEDSAYNRNTIGNAGRFFAPLNVLSLADELRHLAIHRDELFAMRSLARLRVEDELNWDVATQKFLSIYQNQRTI